MDNILIVSSQPQRFLDQLNMAEKISKHTNNIKIYFYINKNIYSRYKSKIDNLGFDIVNKIYQPNSQKNYKVNILDTLQMYFKRLITIKQRKIIRVYINAFKNTRFFTKMLEEEELRYINFLQKEVKTIKNIIKENKIDLIFINGDRHLDNEPAFLKAAKDLSVSIVIPYMVYFAEEEDLTKTSQVKHKLSVFTSDYIKASQNKFLYHKRKNKYFYPHPIINALDKVGTLTKNPWFMGGGSSDILCLPNEHMKKHYVKNGIDINKIKVIGDISYDQLYLGYKKKIEIKKEIQEKYDLDLKVKTIIVSLPQLAEHNILPWDIHWQEINFLIQSLDSLNQNILLSLHPKMDRSSYVFLEKKFNCKILEEKLVDVLPIADMFVATFSSTVFWSIICGIKTVVIDFYGLEYKTYDFLSSIRKVKDREIFQSTLNNTLHETIDFSEDWIQLSKDKVFDGKTIQRYVDLIKEVK